MKSLITRLNLRQWDLLRVLRVGFGVTFLMSGIGAYEPGMAVLGGLVMLQGVFNVGCGCAPGGTCAPTRNSEAAPQKEIEYETVE